MVCNTLQGEQVNRGLGFHDMVDFKSVPFFFFFSDSFPFHEHATLEMAKGKSSGKSAWRKKRNVGKKVASMEQSISLGNDCHLSPQSCTRIQLIVT